MQPIIKAQTNKFKWLASALSDTCYITDTDLSNRPSFMRYICVVNGEAIATNGAAVHILPTPELVDGFYELSGLQLVKVDGVDAPPTYNPRQVVNEHVFLRYDLLTTKTLQDFNPMFLNRILRLKRHGFMFNHEYLVKATNNNERNAFEVAPVGSGGFAFGVNEFGTFFVLSLRPPSFKIRLRMAAIVLMATYNKIIDRVFSGQTTTK